MELFVDLILMWESQAKRASAAALPGISRNEHPIMGLGYKIWGICQRWLYNHFLRKESTQWSGLNLS